MSITIEQCESVLPQTQCRQCSYDGCRPYAAALVSGQESLINRCRPGGQDVVDALAQLFELPSTQPLQEPLAECTVVVNVDDCIGCTLCIQACPVDAIVGAAKMQHQVLQEHCTGCQLCLPICPTACMSIEERTLPLPSPQDNKKQTQQRAAKKLLEKQERMRDHRASIAHLNDPNSVLNLCLKK
jgi:electron transport complex protein RnfB